MDISLKDASLLALLAERPKRDTPVTKRAFHALGDDARKIADALRTGKGESEEATQTAEGLHDWVRTNRTGGRRRRAG